MRYLQGVNDRARIACRYANAARGDGRIRGRQRVFLLIDRERLAACAGRGRVDVELELLALDGVLVEEELLLLPQPTRPIASNRRVAG